MWKEILLYHSSPSCLLCGIDHTQELRQDCWSRPAVSEIDHNFACRKHKKCSWTWIGCLFSCQISRLFSNWKSFQKIELSIAHENWSDSGLCEKKSISKRVKTTSSEISKEDGRPYHWSRSFPWSEIISGWMSVFARLVHGVGGWYLQRHWLRCISL